MRDIENLFSIPVHASLISDNENIQNEMTQAISKIPCKTVDVWGGTHELSTVNFDDNDIERFNLTHTEEMIREELKIYCEYIGFPMRDYDITSWFSKFNPGDYGHVHTHGYADISDILMC